MKKQRLVRYACLLLGLLAGGAPKATAQEPVDTSRVVCVSKQINEFVYAIGAQAHLVGRDLTSVLPARD